MTRLWALALMALLLGAEAKAEDQKKDQVQGNCALVLKLGEWSEKITIPAYEAADEPTIDLSDKKTFQRVQTQADGSEVRRQGQAPPELKPYNIRVSYDRDDKTGWPGHEEVAVEVTIFERKKKTRVEGPFRASVIRKLVEQRETTEDMPFVAGNMPIGAEKLEFRFGCSKSLGT
jgi:hypothetical protein